MQARVTEKGSNEQNLAHRHAIPIRPVQGNATGEEKGTLTVQRRGSLHVTNVWWRGLPELIPGLPRPEKHSPSHTQTTTGAGGGCSTGLPASEPRCAAPPTDPGLDGPRLQPKPPVPSPDPDAGSPSPKEGVGAIVVDLGLGAAAALEQRRPGLRASGASALALPHGARPAQPAKLRAAGRGRAAARRGLRGSGAGP